MSTTTLGQIAMARSIVEQNRQDIAVAEQQRETAIAAPGEGPQDRPHDHPDVAPAASWWYARRCGNCGRRIHRQQIGDWYHDHNASVFCQPGSEDGRKARRPTAPG